MARVRYLALGKLVQSNTRYYVNHYPFLRELPWSLICNEYNQLHTYIYNDIKQLLKFEFQDGHRTLGSSLVTNQDCHTDRFLVEMFHNYAFKECLSVENFFKTILIKLTLGNIFINLKKSTRAAPLSQNSWYIFEMQITPLLRCPQGPQGCLENWNCPPSLNLAQNSETLKNHQKTIIFCCSSNSVDNFFSQDTPGDPGGI